MATNCSNCNNCKDECSCIPTGVTTPNYCLSDTPPCPEPAPCTETFDSQCVIYTGDGNDCLEIESGQTVEEIIDILAEKLEPFICLNCTSAIIPANNAVEVALNQILSWAPVLNAVNYDVYFSTNQNAVTNLLPSALVSSNQILTNYDPSTLLIADTVYYWKIVPRNIAEQIITCPVYKFTTFSECVNPLEEVFNIILDIIPTTGPNPEDLTKLIEEVITDTIKNGFVLGKSCGACCPDCITNRYVLASVSTFGTYYETIYDQGELPEGSPCCVEVTASYSQYSKLGIIFDTIPPTGDCNCDSNYDTCLEQLKGLFQPSVWLTVLETGIVEESTLGGYTSLCILKDFIASLPAVLSQTQKAEILTTLLGVGMVVECKNNGVIITSVDSYLQGIQPPKA
jgi:hypothetical protein